MKRYRLEQIGKIISGGTPSTKIKEYWSGDIPWITPKDLSKLKTKYITHGERNITKQGLDNSSAKLIPKNTILLSSRAPIGYIAIAKNTLTTNQGFKSLICDETKCYYDYFYYWLNCNITYIIHRANGSTFKEISAKTFKKIEIDLPDLVIQKKISNILKKIDEEIEINYNINKNYKKIDIQKKEGKENKKKVASIIHYFLLPVLHPVL